MLKLPLAGVLMYGVAEASTAYLITKITDTPPAPAFAADFAESQIAWKNKRAFLKLSLDRLDVHNLRAMDKEEKEGGRKTPLRQQFT